MKDFNLNRLNVLKELKLNNKASQSTLSGEMAKLQKNILMQAGLALLTIVLTVVILFAVTSAWYTNIVQTGGLVFNVESWGFDGKVEISNVETLIAPGDEGIVSLTAQNDNNDIVEFGVTVEKGTPEKEMNPEMKKRLFFYVDTEQKRNDETMERVYLNSTETYTYTIFSKGMLRLQEDVYNAPRIKWHWVYDLLGYYVLGTQTTAEDGSQTMTVKEYLRPIEYDYESATFEVVEEMAADGETTEKTFRLVSIEGKTVAEFIEEITSTDGYEGITKIENAKEGIYYPVSVDAETGEGVYLYLCTYTEIEMATKWDTETGEIAYTATNDPNTVVDTSRISHTAEIKISAQKSEIVPTEVGTATELIEAISAIEAGQSKVLALSSDITLEETLSVPEGVSVMIDLGGKTITSSVTKTGNEKTSVIEAKPDSSLTLMNGTVDVGTESNIDYAIKTVGAEVVMNDVDIINSNYGVYVGDNLDSNTKDSVIYINKCEINSSTCSVFVSGNGTVSEQKTTVIIEDCTLESDWYAICGNGTKTRWGTDIQVINSRLNVTEYTCIYHPQSDGSLTLSGCELSGPMGIAIKGGDIKIINTNITATGAEFTEEFEYSGSGFNGTNDAIYIETDYSTKENYDITLEINGGIISSMYNYALRIMPDENNVTIAIYEGTFYSASGYNEEFNTDWIAESSAQTVNDESVYVYPVTSEDPETDTETGTDITN